MSSISRGIWVNRIQRRRRSNRIFIILVKIELLIIISSKSRECTSLLSKFLPIKKDLTVGKTKLDTFLVPFLFHAIPVPRIPFINRVVNYIYVERKHGFQVRDYISFKIEEENVARSLINPHNYLSGCSESNFVFFTPILFSRIRQIQSRRNFSSLFIHSVCFDRCLYFVFVSFD